MIFITYNPQDPNAVVLADCKIENFITDELITVDPEILDNLNPYTGTHKRIVIGNELIIYLIRCAVLEGKIPHQSIAFIYHGIVLNLNAEGRFSYYPPGFCAQFDNALDRLLQL